MYIGISAYNHESAAALVDKSGSLIAYYREESLSRIKGDKSFPKRSLSRIISTYSLTPDKVDRIIFYEKPLTAFLHPIKIASQNLPESLPLLVHQFRNFNRSSATIFIDLSKLFPGYEKKLIFIDHHLSHTITALAYSNNRSGLCSIVVDGFGDRSTASISLVNTPNEIVELWSSAYPFSLGLFYSALTDFLGFTINEGEYKVMGLSAFGDPNSRYQRLIKSLIAWDDNQKEINLNLNYFSFHKSVVDSYSNKLVELLGDSRNPFQKLDPKDSIFQKYADIARATQDITIEILCKIFEHAYNLTGSRKFLFSGGVALNSAALDALSKLHFADEIILPPSPGDSGAAIGAAYFGYLKSVKARYNFPKPNLFPSFYSASDQLDRVSQIISDGFEVISNKPKDSLQITARLIEEGKIVGTVISNAETGPRALGNRSLLCNGRDAKAVKILNTVIKNRSPFRPTAPAMTLKTAKKYYALKSSLMQNYYTMNATCKCLANNISLSFPVTHVDGTARLQIVQEDDFLFKLLDILQPKDIDILANSSLNISGDPTAFDLIDGLMVCALSPLEYLLTDWGIFMKK